MKNHYFIFGIVTLLCISILISGCCSYFPISSNDLLNNKPENKIKIILNNKKEVIVENLKDIDFANFDEIVALQNDSTKVTFSLIEVEKISEERFDFGKTFFSTLWIMGGAFALLIGIMLLSSGGRGLRVG